METGWLWGKPFARVYDYESKAQELLKIHEKRKKFLSKSSFEVVDAPAEKTIGSLKSKKGKGKILREGWILGP